MGRGGRSGGGSLGGSSCRGSARKYMKSSWRHRGVSAGSICVGRSPAVRMRSFGVGGGVDSGLRVRWRWRYETCTEPCTAFLPSSCVKPSTSILSVLCRSYVHQISFGVQHGLLNTSNISFQGVACTRFDWLPPACFELDNISIFMTGRLPGLEHMSTGLGSHSHYSPVRSPTMEYLPCIVSHFL